MDSMFCFQCQETFKNSGCVRVGVCGKNPLVAGLQDFLIWGTKKLSKVTSDMREKGLKVEKEINHIVSTNLFVTITNANFDEKAINRRINITLNAIRDLQNSLHLPLDKDVEEYIDADIPKRLGKAMSIGVLQTQDPDKRSLKELIIYGLKGLCAYVKHANVG